jgi:hypothetical protein
MSLRTIIAYVAWFILASKLNGQTYPSNFSWNGCNYIYNGFRSPDTISCKKLNYELVFEDYFDGNVLDRDKWQPFYPWGRSLKSTTSGTGWERQFYADSNVSVSDGLLRLDTKVNPGYRSPMTGIGNVFFNFTSGMVFSVPNFTKGKFEIRCKIPNMNGMFPAFWLFGFCSQEIDVFEFTNESETSDSKEDAKHMIMTYHRQYDCSDTEKGKCAYALTYDRELDLSLDFHVYSVEWNELKIIWKLDGNVVREVYKFWEISPPPPSGPLFGYARPIRSCHEMSPSKAYTVFDPFPSTEYRMHVIVNSAVLRARAINSGALPQTFLIDYVKAYEEIETEPADGVLFDSDFTLFPNPTNGVFSIQKKNISDKIDLITITNAVGKTISFTQEIVGDQVWIKIDEQTPGIYFVRIESNSKVYNKKLISN